MTHLYNGKEVTALRAAIGTSIPGVQQPDPAIPPGADPTTMVLQQHTDITNLLPGGIMLGTNGASVLVPINPRRCHTGYAPQLIPPIATPVTNPVVP